MDLYLSSEPSLTLQEMIECDIKTGISFEDGFAVDLNSLDFSGMSSLEADLDLKTFEPLFDPLDRLDDMDIVTKEEDEFNHETEEVHDTVASWMNMSSMSNYSLDFENSIMVNPSSVIPSTLPSRGVTAAGLCTSAPSSVPAGNTVTSSISHPEALYRNRFGQNGQTITTQVVLCPAPVSSKLASTSTGTGGASLCNNTKLLNSVSGGRSGTITSTITSNTKPVSVASRSNNVSSSTITSSSSFPLSGTAQQNGITNHRSPGQVLSRINNFQTGKAAGNSTLAASRSKYTKFKREKLPDERTFPKPAYSYSCLIALALKNSSSGSLPVSEIYSFMCEHFPYFRTAPNGWKNSVRHNLSLNKCFEKIEKPLVSGGNQRKGCLWALNPAKAHKMDDEVQKWSKKGLQEIKDAMTYPEVLESLERGEMKFETSSGGASSCSEDEDDFEEIDPIASPDGGVVAPNPAPPIKIMNPLTANNVCKPARMLQSTKNIGYLQQSISRSVPHSNDKSSKEYILPHSLPEINIQSNGMLVDDYGNEITIDGDMGVLNPAASASSSSNNILLRQANAASSIRTQTLRTNFIYSPPLSTSHQSPVNRLVLTSVKPL